MSENPAPGGGMPGTPQEQPDERETTEQEEDRLQEEGVEESFPASDPPSANTFE